MRPQSEFSAKRRSAESAKRSVCFCILGAGIHPPAGKVERITLGEQAIGNGNLSGVALLLGLVSLGQGLGGLLTGDGVGVLHFLNLCGQIRVRSPGVDETNA